MSERVRVPGPRAVEATLDEPGADAADPGACVVACPPHPQMGGRRTDTRLTAVSDHLTDNGVACLRFDYGPWDEGRGERTDAASALDWAADRYDTVALFGYSFGSAVTLLVAAGRRDLACVSALAPPSRLSDDADADVVAALDDVAVPAQVVYGERDTTVDWEPVVERAHEFGFAVESMSADHHFVGQSGKLGELVGEFLLETV